jgi:DNA-binding CsgD family transcriptional regulator
LTGLALESNSPADVRAPAHPIKAAAERVFVARGKLRQFRRAFARSSIPMVTVDNDRRQLTANQPARLLLRMSAEDLRDIHIDDLTPPSYMSILRDAWRRLMRDGSVAGRYALGCPDGSEIQITYCALANALPGEHLIVFAPARWPEDEFEEPLDVARDPCPCAVTKREREVLALIAAGADVDQIAAELTISPATVKSHVKNAHRKLGARNRPHAIALALQRGLI